MEIDHIRNKLVPFQARGRWYKFFIESDGTNYKLTTSDLEGCEFGTNYIKLPQGYHVVDIAHDVHCEADDSASAGCGVLRLFAGDYQGVQLPVKASFTYMTLWVFAYQGGD